VELSDTSSLHVQVYKEPVTEPDQSRLWILEDQRIRQAMGGGITPASDANAGKLSGAVLMSVKKYSPLGPVYARASENSSLIREEVPAVRAFSTNTQCMRDLEAPFIVRPTLATHSKFCFADGMQYMLNLPPLIQYWMLGRSRTICRFAGARDTVSVANGQSFKPSRHHRPRYSTEPEVLTLYLGRVQRAFSKIVSPLKARGTFPAAAAAAAANWPGHGAV
jgi:hypothetical protein